MLTCKKSFELSLPSHHNSSHFGHWPTAEQLHVMLYELLVPMPKELVALITSYVPIAKEFWALYTTTDQKIDEKEENRKDQPFFQNLLNDFSRDHFSDAQWLFQPQCQRIAWNPLDLYVVFQHEPRMNPILHFAVRCQFFCDDSEIISNIIMLKCESETQKDNEQKRQNLIQQMDDFCINQVIIGKEPGKDKGFSKTLAVYDYETKLTTAPN